MTYQQKKVAGYFEAFLKGDLESRNRSISLYKLTWIDCKLKVEDSQTISVDENEDDFSTLKTKHRDQEQERIPSKLDGKQTILQIPSLPSVKASYNDIVADLSIYSSTLTIEKITPVRRTETFRLQHVTGYLQGSIETGGPPESDNCGCLMLLLFFIPLLLLLLLPCGWWSFLVPVAISLIYFYLYRWICTKKRCAQYVTSLVNRIMRFRWFLVFIQVGVLSLLIYLRSHYYGECLDLPWILWFLGAIALCFWSLKGLRRSILIPGILWVLICLLMMPIYCDFMEGMGAKTLPELVQQGMEKLQGQLVPNPNQSDENQASKVPNIESEGTPPSPPGSPQASPSEPPQELMKDIPRDPITGEPMCGFTQELSNNFLFDTGTSFIKPVAKKHLSTLSKYIKTLHRDNPGLKVTILGYADHRGDEAYNQNLSQQRALAIHKYFNIIGVNRYIMNSRGEGEIKADENITDDELLSKYRKVIVSVTCEEDQ